MHETRIELATVSLPEVQKGRAVELRKARLSDVEAIYWLIRYWAEKGLMLVRSHSHLYENIRDFQVLEDEDGHIVGTVALHVLWRDLAEIRGLAVHPMRRGEGLGRWLVLGGGAGGQGSGAAPGLRLDPPGELFPLLGLPGHLPGGPAP